MTHPVWYYVEKLSWYSSNDTLDYCDTLEEAEELYNLYKNNPKEWDTKSVELSYGAQVLRSEKLSYPWA